MIAILVRVGAQVVVYLTLAGCSTIHPENSEIIYGSNRGITDYYVVSGAGSVGSGYLFNDRYYPYNYAYYTNYRSYNYPYYSRPYYSYP